MIAPFFLTTRFSSASFLFFRCFLLCWFFLRYFFLCCHSFHHLPSGVINEKIFSITKYKRIFFNVKKIFDEKKKILLSE